MKIKYLLIPVLVVTVLLTSCSTMVKLQTEPQGVDIIYEGKNLGKGPVDIEISNFIFQDGKITFKQGDRTETAQLQRRISIVHLIFSWLFVPLLWIAPPKENQLFVLTNIKGGGGVPANYAAAFRDVVLLKNGQRIDNCKAAVTADSIVITTSDGRTLVYPKAQVDSVRRGN